MQTDLKLRAEMAHNIGHEFIRDLEKDDANRKKSRHKTSVVQLRSLMARYAIEAGQHGIEIDPVLAVMNPPHKTKRAGNRLIALAALIFVAVFVLAAISDKPMARVEQATQESAEVNYFYDPLKGTEYEGQDYLPPEEQ